MNIKQLFATVLGCIAPALLAAQPAIYNDNTTLITGTWQAAGDGGSATLAEVTGQTPYEGQRHYRFDYAFTQWWAGLGLNMDNWGAAPARDFSGYTHLRIAYLGLSAGQSLSIRLRNGADYGNAIIIGGQTSDYTVVELSLIALTVGSPLSPDAVREINLSIESPVMSGNGTVFFDAIELVNSGGGPDAPAPASATTLARAAALGAGVNTSNWLEAYWLLPFNAYPEVNRYNRARVQALRDAGFITFRLPVIFERLGSDSPPYTLNFNHIAFSLVDSMIQWAAEMEFTLIIDNHHGLPLTNANYLGEIPRLQAVWQQLAQRYGQLDPNRYLFEIYNEPDNQISNANWRTVATSVLQTIRQHESVTHSVLVGGTNWNSGPGLLSFIPLNDPDVIYTFHYYEPYFFTHQGMSWTSPPYLAPRTYPLPGETDALLQLMSGLQDWSEQYQVPVNMGEFGCATSADAVSRCNWVSAVMNAVNTYGFSYFYWDAISPTDAFGFFNNGVVSLATGIPCFVNALGLYMTPLSVELLAFDLECNPGITQLYWTAYSDDQTSRFEVQRSFDGVQWAVLHTISAQKGRHNYTFTDENSAPNALYRLHNINLNEESDFSPLRISTCEHTPALSAFPNPANETVRLRLDDAKRRIALVRLFDAGGRMLQQQQFGPDILTEEVEIPVSAHPPGGYVLSVFLSDGVVGHVKIVVER